MSANLRTRAALAAGIMLGGMTMLSPGVALSQSANPSNITGRWFIFGNNSNGDLNIRQSGNGTISGTIFGSPLEGYYTPSSRRLVFLVKVNGSPVQFYSAWISNNGLLLGGQFNVWNLSDGAAQGVDYNFSGSKTSDFP